MGRMVPGRAIGRDRAYWKCRMKCFLLLIIARREEKGQKGAGKNGKSFFSAPFYWSYFRRMVRCEAWCTLHPVISTGDAAAGPQFSNLFPEYRHSHLSGRFLDSLSHTILMFSLTPTLTTRGEACHWILSRLQLPANPIPLPPLEMTLRGI